MSDASPGRDVKGTCAGASHPAIDSIYRCHDGADEKVKAWGRLPEAAVKAFGLKRGDFMHG
jgi:hypothetical protein